MNPLLLLGVFLVLMVIAVFPVAAVFFPGMIAMLVLTVVGSLIGSGVMIVLFLKFKGD